MNKYLLHRLPKKAYEASKYLILEVQGNNFVLAIEEIATDLDGEHRSKVAIQLTKDELSKVKSLIDSFCNAPV